METQKKGLKNFSPHLISTSGPIPPNQSRKKLLHDMTAQDPDPDAPATTTTKTTNIPQKPKAKSIFAQRMAMSQQKKSGATMAKPSISISSLEASTSDFLQVTRDIEEMMRASGLVSEEEKITPADLIQMKKEMLRKLSPKDINFLRSQMAKKEATNTIAAKTRSEVTSNAGSSSRGTSNDGSSGSTNLTESKPVETPSNSRSNGRGAKKKSKMLPIDPDTVEMFPHMNRIEIPKLEWTMPLTPSTTKSSKSSVSSSANITLSQSCSKESTTISDGQQQQTNQQDSNDVQARFDLHGKLIDVKRVTDSTWLQGLHNHGEEMEKPGYTFEELLSLARSTVASQRALALHAMAGIFKNAHEGIYDTVLTVNPLDLLANVDVVSVIRKCLDFSDVITLDAASSCMAAIIFPTVEEECYDLVYLYPDAKPFLWHQVISENAGSLSKDPTTRDHQILQLDLLSFLMDRSHILQRIEYLLIDRKDRVTHAMEVSMLQILVRLARHSPSRVLKSENLMEHIIGNIMSLDWTAICTVPPQGSTSKASESSKSSNNNNNCSPMAISIWMAMKLFRILVESSYENAKKVHEEYNLMTYVISYLASDYQNRYGVKSCCHAKFIVLECFRFWSSSLDVGLGINEFTTIFPLLALNLRQYCEMEALTAMTGFDGYYVAQVFNFLKCILICGERKYPTIDNKESAWTLVKDLEYFVLTITMNMLQVLTTVREDWTLALAGKGLEFLTTALKWGKLDHRKASIIEHVKQLDMTEISDSLQQHSLILNMSKIKSRYPSNYVSSSAILTSSNVNYIVARKTPFQFYKPWVNFLLELGCKNLVFTMKTWEYIELVGESYPLEFFETYYIRFEQLCLFKLLISADISDINFGVLVHLICTLSKSDVRLFKGLLELIVNQIGASADQCEGTVKLYMACYFPNVKTEDIPVLDGAIRDENDETLVSKPMLFQPFPTKLVSGKFWMLEPLNRLSSRYSKSRADLMKHLPAVLHETRTCLHFIQYFLTESSVFVSPSDVVAFYIRITQVFSMGEDVFMDREIDILLGNLLKGLIVLWDNFGSQKPSRPFTTFKPGSDFAPFSSMLDFYGDLVREFENLSFCSNVFSAYLLFPLLPSEAREMKLLFWSMQGLPFVRIELENKFIPPDYLTKEVESDRALLQLYTLLLMKTKTIDKKNNELLFHILEYHVTRGLPEEDMQKVLVATK